jgi:hypothetical protein
MLRYFPEKGVAYPDHKRDYYIATFTFIVTGIINSLPYRVRQKSHPSLQIIRQPRLACAVG